MSAMDTDTPPQEEGVSRYGVASLDQMDDDEPGQSSAPPAAAAAAAAGTSSGEGEAKDAPQTVDSYAFAVGVIEPPPDLKVIIDRTADFVRRVGPQFEGEIMQRNKGKKQFQFLENPASPYHAYYKQRVKYGAEGPPESERAAAAAGSVGARARAMEQTRIKESEAQQAAEAAAEAAAKAPKVLTLVERMRAYIDSTHTADKQRVQEAEQARQDALQQRSNGAPATAAPAATSGLIHPSRAAPAGSATASTPAAAAPSAVTPAFSFRVKHPEHYSAVDIDIIKLTALYLSRCGTEFLQGLQRREARNPYFDFLKPQHPLFVFFQHLVEAYNAVLIPKKGQKEELENAVKRSRSDYWQQLLVDAAVKKKLDAARDAAKAEEEAERSGVAQIDWRDFVVVETITFRDDEDAYLPAPRNTVEEMATMLAAQTLSDTSAGGAGETDMETDMDMDTQEGQPAAPAPAAVPAPASTANAAENEEVARLIRSSVVIPDEEQLEIRTHVDEGSAAKARSAVFQKCVVCGDEIAIDDLAEHMRIELLDPRWKEQKQALLDKQRESSLAADSIVSANLARLAKRVIGSGDSKEHEQRSELKARKQAAADAALLYGAHSQQAIEAAAKAGQIIIPPPPPKPQPPPAAPAPVIGPAGGYRPPPPGAYQPPPPPPPAPAAAAAAPAAAHIPMHRPLPPTSVAAMPPPPAQAQPPRPPQPQAAPAPGTQSIPATPGMMRVQPSTHFPGMPPFTPAGAYGPPFPGAMPPPPPGAAFPPHRPAMQAPPGMPVPAAAPIRAPPGMPVEDQQAQKKQRVEVPGMPVAAVAAAPAPPAAAPAAAAATAAAAAASAAAGGKAKLIPEAEFRASHPATVTLRVAVPNDPAVAFHFNGQTITLQAQLSDSVQSVKEQLSGHLNKLAPNKMKLQFTPGTGTGVTAGGTHLNKDDATLAFYNVPDGATLSVGIKERGGKKK